MPSSCPGPLVGQLAEAGALAVGSGLSSVLAVWRAPDRLARAPAWREPRTDMVDIQVFGEIGLIAARRGAGGRAGVVPFGPVAVPRGTKGGVIVGEIRATANGTVAMRGPMVPRFAFPPGVERTALPQLKVATERLCRYRLCLLERPGQRAPGGHRAAARDGQRRRLSLPDARPAGRRSPRSTRPRRWRRCPMR